MSTTAAGKPAEAAKQYEALAKLDPGNPDYLVGWGNLLLEDHSVEMSKRRAAAAAVWQRLADARSDDAVITSQVADLMRKGGQHRQGDRIVSPIDRSVHRRSHSIVSTWVNTCTVWIARTKR